MLIKDIATALLQEVKTWARQFHNKVNIRRRFYSSNIQADVSASIDYNSKIGDYTFISRKSSIRNSVISENCFIGASSTILSCTIGKGAHIGNSLLLEDSVVGNNVAIHVDNNILKSTIHSFATIHQDCWITNTVIESFSYIGRNSHVHDTQIGKFCSIAANLSTGSGNHPTNLISTSPIFYSPSIECGITFCDEQLYNSRALSIIGNDVWIGANVFIKSGISIGNGAIIAAGAVVVKDVEPYSIVGGVPAKLLRKRFSEDSIKILETLAWWNWEEKLLQEATPFMQKGDVVGLYNWYRKK